jgi:hypothetical protein
MLNTAEIKVLQTKSILTSEDALTLVADMLDYTAQDPTKTAKCAEIKASFTIWNFNFNWASYKGDRTGKNLLAHAMKNGFSI